MIRPIDLQDDDLWQLLEASRNGEQELVRSLIGKRPELVRAEYNYTPPLHFAVREGHAGIVRLLLENGANLTYQTYPFLDPLLTIAQDREHYEVAQVLRELLDKQFPVTDGISAFLRAARTGDIARVQTDLAHNPHLATGSDGSGETALHQAAAGGHVSIVNALLDAGAPADAVRGDGKRPIICALDQRNISALAKGVLAGILLARGAAYNLYLAAVFGDLSYLKEMLAKDSSLANFEDSSHRRPLSAVARRGDMEGARLLLAHGANPSLPEEGAPDGLALWIAIYQNQPAMAKLLLEHGANPNTAPESSGSALLHTEKRPRLRKLLLKYGAREDVSDRTRLEKLIAGNALAEVEAMLQGNRLLSQDSFSFWAEGLLARPANDGNQEMLELLLRYGATVPDVVKWGPQYYFKHLAIASFLLERGMNPNQMNWQRFTLLHHFAAESDIQKVNLLLDHGADINAVDEEYRSSPLGCAARWGREEMVRLLLARGANPNLAGAPWAAPIEWARKKGYPVIEAVLLGAGALDC